MKKLITLLLVLCLVFAGAFTWLSAEGLTIPFSFEEEEEGESAAGAAGQTQRLDYEKLYRTHSPEDVVLRIGGRDVTWSRYFYILFAQGRQTENYFQAAANYYGLELSWSDEAAEGVTYAQDAVRTAEDNLRQFYAIEGFAAENGAALTEADRAAIAEQLQQDIVGICGEGATEADFEEYLSGLYMDMPLYNWINEINRLYQQGYIQLYGQNGENYSEEAAMAWLEDNGYMAANHILLATVDLSTGEALPQEEIDAKQTQAQELLDQLRAAPSREELLALFAQLKESYCEDSGKTAYPDGYIFTPGTMVQAFEDTVQSLGEYELGLAQSDYGYHIILRLPLDVDRTLTNSTLSARSSASNEEYGSRLQAYYDALTVEPVNGFRSPDLLKYLP